MKCRNCGKNEDKEIIESLGECLMCDHIRGNAQDEINSLILDYGIQNLE